MAPYPALLIAGVPEQGISTGVIPPFSRSQLPKRPFKELFGEGQMLLNIRLQMPGARLPIVGRITDAAGEEDEFVRIGWRKHKILGIAPHHALPHQRSLDSLSILSQYRVCFSSPVLRSTPFSTRSCKSLVAVALEVSVIFR